jgi:hypothetical protein
MTNDEVDSQITRRLVVFPDALIRRGQIAPAAEELPSSLVVAGGFEIIPDVRLLVEADRPISGR